MIDFVGSVLAPGVVSQPQYTPSTPFSYVVSWKQPCHANGILKLFRVMVKGTRDNHPDDTFSYSVMPNTSVSTHHGLSKLDLTSFTIIHVRKTITLQYPDAIYSVRLPKLRPVYKYTIAISASVENVLDFGEAVIIEMSTPPSCKYLNTFSPSVRRHS